MLYLYTLQLEKLEKKRYKLYMNQIKPMLLTTLESYNRSQFIKDVTAGIIVAIIALPLSIALALASGVGPQAGIFTAIVAGFVISTILAGIFLILMGLCHFGSLIKFIPYTITTGFTSGIAVTIVIGQLKDFFGVTYPNGLKPIETMEKLNAFALGFSSFHVDALIVGGVSLAILIISPYIFKRIPGSLIAVVIGILMVKFLPLHVSTIRNLYTITNNLPSFHIPAVKFSMVKSSIPNAFTIAVLAAIESLLSCVVADGMINGKHRSDTELVAQGLGNIASALFGGIPATGAIARTAANIKNGGRTPVAGMVPMPTIAAILYVDDDTPEIDDHLARLPLAIRVYEITGPLFFGASDAIEHIVVKDFTKCLILRMRSVPALDSTALNALKDLVDTCEKKGITIVFSHVNEQPMKVMKKAGFIELVGKEHFCPNITAALKHAEDYID